MTSINLQRVGEAVIADGSITTPKLADAAVTDIKLADDSVITTKLADLAISTNKLQNNVVTLAKSDRALKIHHLLTDDTPQSVVGTVEEEIKTYKFVKANTVNEGFVPNKMQIQAQLKSSVGTNTASLKIYVDTVLALTLTSVNTVFELLSGETDVSALANGVHDVSVRLVNSAANGTATNQLFTSFLEK